MTTDANKQILVTEDNTVLADVLRFNLERAGFSVTVARTGREALDLARSQHYDLLLTDYNMPELTGEELIVAVRGELGLSDMPIVMCSAKGLELDTERLIAQWRVDRVVFKPFSVRDILTVVRTLLAAPSLAG